MSGLHSLGARLGSGAWLAGGALAMGGVQGICLLALIHIASPAEAGRWATVWAIVTPLFTLAGLGARRLVPTEPGTVRGERYSNLLVTTSAIATLLSLILVALNLGSAALPLAFALLVFKIAEVRWELAAGFLLKEGRGFRLGGRQVLYGLLATLLILTSVLVWRSAVAASLALALSFILVTWREYAPIPRWSAGVDVRLFLDGVAISMSGFAGHALVALPRLTLERAVGLESVAGFATITSALGLMGGAVGASAQTRLPMFAALRQAGENGEIRRRLWSAALVRLGSGIAMAVAVILLAPLVRQVTAFTGTLEALAIIAIGIAFNFPGWDFEFLLIALGRRRLQVGLQLGTLLVSGLIVWPLTWTYGVTGAALYVIFYNVFGLILKIVASEIAIREMVPRVSYDD